MREGSGMREEREEMPLGHKQTVQNRVRFDKYAAGRLAKALLLTVHCSEEQRATDERKECRADGAERRVVTAWTATESADASAAAPRKCLRLGRFKVEARMSPLVP